MLETPRIIIFFRWLATITFVLAGLNHFRDPDFYLAMMPAWVPMPDFAHKLAGFFEIMGGVGLQVERSRRPAALGLMVLLLAVFPANVLAALHPEMHPDQSALALWARLPFQFVFLYWVWVVGLKPADPTSSST